MKVIKAKKVRVIAKGMMARAFVLSGRMQKTLCGMTMANSSKKQEWLTVSKKASE